jgi:beta-glucanase (GH16 family)
VVESSEDTQTEVVFFDDFAAGALDRTTWNVRVTGKVVNDELQAYIDSPDTISVEPDGPDNQVLVIHPHHRPGFVTDDGQKFDFVSGRLDTRGRFDFRYGTASARIKLPVGAGLWPAFWMFDDGPWPDSGEIDVMEYAGEPEWITCAAHGRGYCGDAALVNRWYFGDGGGDADGGVGGGGGGGGATDWHVYSVDRMPDQMVFRVDDRVVYRVTRPMVDFFGTWGFDADKFLILNLALGGGYPFKSNGLREPYYGLGVETVEAIRRGEARVLVDWVSVTRPTDSERTQLP